MTAFRTAAIATVTVFAAFAAQAAEPTTCAHPALGHGAACTAQAGIDPNTFLVQPPATTRWLARGGRANFDHPAVAVARLQRAATVDANTFLVQPPVAVTWTVQEPATVLAATPGTVTR